MTRLHFCLNHIVQIKIKADLICAMVGVAETWRAGSAEVEEEQLKELHIRLREVEQKVAS